MPEPTSSGTIAAGAAIKYFGVPAVMGAIGAGLGFAILWPKTRQEAAVRFSVSIASSFIFGPIGLAVLHQRYPEIFGSAAQLANAMGAPPMVGFFTLAAPVFVLAALVAWWPLGWIVRTLEKRKDADLVDVVNEARQAIAGKGE